MNLFDKELLLITRPQKNAPEITVTWAYPASYSVGMAGLGYQLIWWLLEQEPDLRVCRTFTDVGEDGWTRSDLLGFTLSWELDYAGVLSLLRRASIPLLASERKADEPIIFGGGPVLTANPEPFAEIFDVILLGDAEITIPALIEGFRQARRLPDRQARLEHLSKIAGLYVPSLYRYRLAEPQGALLGIEPVDGNARELVRQTYVAPDNYLAHSVILNSEASWGDMFLLELTRSCPQECRFCLAGYLTRPFRAANIDEAVRVIDFAGKYTRRIGILGPSVTEHPRFAELARALLKRPELSISISSIRMDTVDPLVLQTLVNLGQRSVTIALESGSERLRRLMRKNLSEDEIWQGLETIAASGIEKVKFYGMVGLPGERQEDLDETVRLLSAIKKKYRRLHFTLGVSSFVPKAQTPFQWYPRDRQCASKIAYLKKHLCRLGIDLRAESHNWSDIQALLSRADRRLTPLLLSLSESPGNLGAWKKAFRQRASSCPSPDFYVFREIPQDEFLPWEHLMDAPKKAVLSRQRRLFEEANV